MALPPALVRLAAFADLSPQDLAALIPMAGKTREFKRGEQLLHEGDESRSLYLLLEGWTASTITLADGARQMLRVQLPGDMIGLPSLSVTQIPDTVTALTAVTASSVPLPALGQLFERSPRLGALLFLVSQHERVILMDHLTALGRVSAPGRLALLLLEFEGRVQSYATAAGDTIDLPLRQEDLADLIGTSHVHLSRIMAGFRRDGIISYNRRSITIRSKDELWKLAGLPKRVPSTDQDWLPRSKDDPRCARPPRPPRAPLECDGIVP